VTHNLSEWKSQDADITHAAASAAPSGFVLTSNPEVVALNCHFLLADNPRT